MNDDFDIPQAPAPTLPAAAARAAGWGVLGLFAFLGFCAWRKYRR